MPDTDVPGPYPVRRQVTPANFIAGPLCFNDMKNKGPKKLLRWFSILMGVFIAIILIDIAILAMPGSFFPEKKQYRSIIVYSEMSIGNEIDSIMKEVFKRLD